MSEIDEQSEVKLSTAEDGSIKELFVEADEAKNKVNETNPTMEANESNGPSDANYTNEICAATSVSVANEADLREAVCEVPRKDFYNEENVDLLLNPSSKKEGLGEKLKNKKGIWGVLGGILIFLAKFKAIIFLLLSKLKVLLVVLKLGKFASTFASMFLMIAVYASIYGWSFGIGFVVLLFIHEMGHYFAAKSVKVKTSVPLFIPFFGALISLKEAPKDAVTEAKLAIGGPAAGTLGAIACVLLYFVTSNNLFLALAYVGFMLNLFNLIPVHPMDGGRIVTAISPVLWAVGIVIAIVIAITNFNPILFMILFMGVIQLINTWKNPDKSYYKVPLKYRVVFALLYFGLLAFLGASMAYIHGIHGDIGNRF